MIEVENVHKSFGETHVLKGISTIFEQGKTNLVIGQSGSGKTVLMKSLLGLIEPEEGKICYDGQYYWDLSRAEQRDLRQEMGMVFQQVIYKSPCRSLHTHPGPRGRGR